ncbi:2-dehydropantoate 2-reductase (Ketopantoate reductase) (KPA reductase) (KPR) [Lecanicillium sp. MT-2017a]|nr:2-dehydropantoate 2-reductase (Ketopantoate reductase) (KPA reductase) (KPR) [Lecanicillium sp. MT-2017a]
MGSSSATARPQWLSSLLADSSPPRKLYAWTPAHLTQLGPSNSAPANASAQREQDRIYILGIGNLGRMYASYLASRPNPPPITLVVHRKELLSQWDAGEGIEIVLRSGETRRNKGFAIEFWNESPPPSGQPAREVADGGKLHNLFITTKASAALPEVDRLRGYLDSCSTVCFAQNGMSKLWPPHGPAYMAARYPDGNGFNATVCVTNHGLYSEGPFKSVFASPADAYVGAALLQKGPPAPSVAYFTDQIVSTPDLEATSYSSLDVWILQLEKLIVNTSINPLSAIVRCKTGVLFEEPDGTAVQVMDRMLVESSNIFQALINHESTEAILTSGGGSESGNSSVEETRRELRERFSVPRLREMLHRVAQRVKDNKSSMYQDVEAGKPTEIRDFNGWMVEMAQFLDQGLDVTVHEKCIDLVERRVVLDKKQLGEYFL